MPPSPGPKPLPKTGAVKKKRVSAKGAGRKSKATQRRRPRPRSQTTVWRLLTIFTLWGALGLGLVGLWFSYDLPTLEGLTRSTRMPAISIYARNGTLLGTSGDYYAKPVRLSELPPYVPRAFMAIEDHRFYDHKGVDLWGLARALVKNVRQGSVVQGGSTITQQLAKDYLVHQKLYKPEERSVRRKIQELILAFWLERALSKDAILTLYLNRVYFGYGVNGLQAAALRYFQKPARRLGLYEAAVLAALLKAPSAYNPRYHPQKAHQRASLVLQTMQASGWITPEQQHHALSQEGILQRVKERGNSSRYFCDWVIDQAQPYLRDVDADVVIETTLDLGVQTRAEEALRQALETEGTTSNCHQGAIITTTRQGQILAMVGGADYEASQFNRVTQAKRQPGSLFKVIVYAQAFQKGVTPDMGVSDGPFVQGTWRPKNYDWVSQGTLTIEQAFAHSVNTSAIRVMKHVGVSAVIDLATQMGIAGPLPKDLSLALGTGEVTAIQMAQALSGVMNLGRTVKPWGIRLMKTTQGKVVYRGGPVYTGVLLNPTAVAALYQVMASVMHYGTGRKVTLDKPCWGKTGTTQNHRDAWFGGFTHDHLTIVWLGNDDNTPMKRVTGARLPGTLWRQVMQDL